MSWQSLSEVVLTSLLFLHGWCYRGSLRRCAISDWTVLVVAVDAQVESHNDVVKATGHIVHRDFEHNQPGAPLHGWISLVHGLGHR